MILQALVQRYEDSEVKVPLYWQKRNIDFAVNLNLEGDILDITPLWTEEGKKKIRRIEILPEEPPGRTSGIKAGFLCDNESYIFGKDPKRGTEKYEAARALHNEVLAQAGSSVSDAIKAYFAHPMQDDLELDRGVYTFQVNGLFAYEDEAIREAWNKYKETIKEGEIIRCLVSGEFDHIDSLHGKIALPGVSMGSVPFISINAESFTSYGSTSKDPAARIGQESSFKYASALNNLLQDAKHVKRLGQDTLVYWAEGDDRAEMEVMDLLAEPKEDDQAVLEAIITNIANGAQVNVDGCDLSKQFYLLCLSPNAGRISVRFFHHNRFGNIVQHITDHYRNLKILGKSKFAFIPPWMILSETTVKKKTKDVLPLLGGQLFESIISSKIYPMTLYHAILRRIRAGEETNTTKAAIIKAILIKNFGSEVATVALNKESNNIPYTLGRLFSILENLQERAIGSSTIRQSYFSSASTNPSTVFPRLLALSMHHADKLDSSVWFEQQKGDLIDKLDPDNPFPQTLSLQEQGEFIVGYYHQQQERYKKKEEK